MMTYCNRFGDVYNVASITVIINACVVATGLSYDSALVRRVEINRDVTGSLGLSVAGGLASPLGDMPVMVASVNPEGPAASADIQVIKHL